MSAAISTGSLIDEASDGLRYLGLPFTEGEHVKIRIARAAERAKLSYWRAFDLWYRKARQVLAEEIELIRAAVRRAKQARESEKTHGLERLAGDLEALARRVSALDSRAGRHEADRMRDLARRARCLAQGVELR